MGSINNKFKSVYMLPLSRIAEVKPFQSKINIERETIDIIIIGAGGTGGYLIRDLSRFVYSLNQRLIANPPKIKLTIVDGDIVEEKNILRQNFLRSDIGKYKAEVMATRHMKAFGIDIEYITKMLDENDFYYVPNNPKIFVGCVDNNEARRAINKITQRLQGYTSYRDKIFWIDSGNEKKTGQIVVGNERLNNIVDLFPEILDPKNDSFEQVSCAERMLQDEQNMFVNLTAATVILNYIKSLILDIPMVAHGTVFNIDNKFDNYYIT